MKSIRLFLIAGTVAILILYNFIAALRGYQSSMREADTLFDNQLLDLSQLVAHLDVTRITRDFRLGNNLAFQVWEDDRLLAASFHAPAERMNDFTPGFNFANFDSYRWRTYTRYDEAAERWIIVAERSDLRFVLGENVVLESVTPVLLGIPLVALMIWLIVGHGLKPLQLLSADLRQKRVQDLSPLPPRQIPHELDQVVQSINGLISRLSEAFEREKRFSADAAHELRTPVSALKIQLHNLAQETDVKSEAFVALQQGVERMQHLLEQLLSFYRSSPDQFAANRTRLDLLVIVQDVVARLYPLVEQKHQSLELQGENAFVDGERFALETMVANLLSNASRYSPEGGRILLRLIRREQTICLVVEDNGPGIPEEEQTRVFERFYRGGSASSSGVAGCGLGLTIVAHVAELHDAKVSIGNSSMGRGTAFYVCFPEPRDGH